MWPFSTRMLQQALLQYGSITADVRFGTYVYTCVNVRIINYALLLIPRMKNNLRCRLTLWLVYIIYPPRILMYQHALVVWKSKCTPVLATISELFKFLFLNRQL